MHTPRQSAEAQTGPLSRPIFKSYFRSYLLLAVFQDCSHYIPGINSTERLKALRGQGQFSIHPCPANCPPSPFWAKQIWVGSFLVLTPLRCQLARLAVLCPGKCTQGMHSQCWQLNGMAERGQPGKSFSWDGGVTSRRGCLKRRTLSRGIFHAWANSHVAG